MWTHTYGRQNTNNTMKKIRMECDEPHLFSLQPLIKHWNDCAQPFNTTGGGGWFHWLKWHQGFINVHNITQERSKDYSIKQWFTTGEFVFVCVNDRGTTTTAKVWYMWDDRWVLEKDLANTWTPCLQFIKTFIIIQCCWIFTGQKMIHFL